MVKCKNCWFKDYIQTGICHGYDYCVLHGTKKVDKEQERNCNYFQPNLIINIQKGEK